MRPRRFAGGISGLGDAHFVQRGTARETVTPARSLVSIYRFFGLTISTLEYTIHPAQQSLFPTANPLDSGETLSSR